MSEPIEPRNGDELLDQEQLLQVADELGRCASHWVCNARLVGNIPAGEIMQLCMEFSLLAEKLAELEKPCVWTPHVSGTFFTSCGDKWNTSSWDINKSILPDYYNHCPLCGHRITEEPTDGR